MNPDKGEVSESALSGLEIIVEYLGSNKFLCGSDIRLPDFILFEYL